MAQIKTYNAHRRTTWRNGRHEVKSTAHVGYSGFTNYFPGTSEDIAAALEKVFEDHPGSVVINGTADWLSPRFERPETFRHQFDIQPLAMFHSGISGISKSGIVVTAEDYQKILREFPDQTWGRGEKAVSGIGFSDTKLRVYEDPSPQE